VTSEVYVTVFVLVFKTLTCVLVGAFVTVASVVEVTGSACFEIIGASEVWLGDGAGFELTELAGVVVSLLDPGFAQAPVPHFW